MQTTFFVTCSVTESSSVTEHVTLVPQVAVTIISRLGQHILGTKVPPFFSYLSRGLLTQLLPLHRGICTHTAQSCGVAAGIPQEWHRSKLPLNYREEGPPRAFQGDPTSSGDRRSTNDSDTPSDSLEPQGQAGRGAYSDSQNSLGW